MDIRALTKRDKMRRIEIKDLKKQVTKLTKLLRKQEKEIRWFKGSGKDCCYKQLLCVGNN